MFYFTIKTALLERPESIDLTVAGSQVINLNAY